MKVGGESRGSPFFYATISHHTADFAETTM